MIESTNTYTARVLQSWVINYSQQCSALFWCMAVCARGHGEIFVGGEPLWICKRIFERCEILLCVCASIYICKKEGKKVWEKEQQEKRERTLRKGLDLSQHRGCQLLAADATFRRQKHKKVKCTFIYNRTQLAELMCVVFIYFLLKSTPNIHLFSFSFTCYSSNTLALWTPGKKKCLFTMHFLVSHHPQLYLSSSYLTLCASYVSKLCRENGKGSNSQ